MELTDDRAGLSDLNPDVSNDNRWRLSGWSAWSTCHKLLRGKFRVFLDLPDADWSGDSAVHTEPIAAYEPVREAREKVYEDRLATWPGMALARRAGVGVIAPAQHGCRRCYRSGAR